MENPQFTCISCAIAFPNAESQRDHYRSDHHRYNVKRRVAGLPAVNAEIFNLKVVERQREAEAAAAVTGKTCEICKKSYTSDGAYQTHIASKKHREKEVATIKELAGKALNVTDDEPVPVSKPSPNDATPSSRKINKDGDTIEQTTDGPSSSRHTISPNWCLFCAAEAPALEANVKHMRLKHGFFIPDQEYLTDLPGLLEYCAKQITVDHACLWCRRSFYTLEGVRGHMQDKSHCKLAYDTPEQQLEVSDFYDFAASYANAGKSKGRKAARPVASNKDDEWEDEDGDANEDDVDEVVEEDDEELGDEALVSHGDSAFELVLPSGARIGHRSLKRYYTQRFSDPLPNISAYSNSETAIVKRLLKDTRSALIPAGGADFGGAGNAKMTIKARSIGAAKEAGRHIREHRDTRKQQSFKTKVGFRHNYQKHFRDPLLQ